MSPCVNMHPQDIRSSYTNNSSHLVPLSHLISYHNILVPLRPGSKDTSVTLFCFLSQVELVVFPLCAPTAHFHASVMTLDSVSKIGVVGCDSLIECGFCHRQDLVLFIWYQCFKTCLLKSVNILCNLNFFEIGIKWGMRSHFSSQLCNLDPALLDLSFLSDTIGLTDH